MTASVGTDDANNNRVIDERDFNARPIVFGETEQDGVSGKTTSELQTPTDYTGIYDTWANDPDLDLDDDSSTGDANGKDAPWYFGENDEYPVLKIDVDLDGDIDQDDYDEQQPGPANQRPTVSISLPSSVTPPVDGGTRITLQVEATDPDGSIASYAWSATGGTFANDATRNATWTAPEEQATEQTYTLTLTVEDNGGARNSATVDISVRAANMLPTVSIQPVTQQVAGGANVIFDATANDPDGSIASYDWNAPSSGGTFVDDTIEDATWTAPAEQATAQTYTLTLTVTDDRGGKTTVEVEITVQATNKAPRVTIHTGTRTVDGGDVVTLSATSEDPDQDGSIVSYLWTATNDAGTFGNAADEDTTWTAPAKTSNEQRIELTLTATDNEGGTGDASVIIKVAANNQPTASITTPEQEVDGGDVVTLQATATDDDDTTLTYQWTANPDVGDFSDAAILKPTWTAPAKTNDEQEVTLTLAVSDGTSTSTAEVTITVLANIAPTISITTTEREVAGGETVSLQATATDQDDNILTYQWSADDGTPSDDGSFVNGETLTPTWTAPAKTNADRPIRLTLTVTDAGRLTATASVVITVLANVAPEATIITEAQEVDGGSQLILQATATDGDDNTLTYAWSADDGTFSDDEALTPTWTAPDRANAAQTIALTLKVTDPGGLTGTDTVTITVDSNQSPTVSISTVFKLVDGGEEVELEATASDPDQDDTLTYAWTATGGTFANPAIEDATWTAPDTQNTAQAITLTLKVTDPDGLSAIATVNFTVRANRAPTVTIDDPAQTPVEGGAAVNLAATVDDQDTGDTHTYRWHADGGTFSDNDVEDPTWTAPAAQSVPRSYTLTLIVTDNGNLTGSDAITITVRDDSTEPDPNNAPTVNIDTEAQIVDGGAMVALQATAADQDTGDTLTHAWTGQGTFADDAAEDTTWTAPTRLTAVQPILLTLTVTDTGGLKAVDTVVMTVSANSLPEVEITSDYPQPVDGNAEVQLFASASDPDNDDLTYQWSADPDRGSFDDAATLDTTWTAPDAASTDQAYTLSLTVEDSGGLQVGDAITVIVRANQQPTVEITTAATTVDGEAVVDLAATASDPDDEDNTLKYRWTANPNYGNFANANALTTTWTALPTPDTSLPIDLTLTVTDPDGLEATDNVTITVRGSTTAPPPPPPRPPDRGDDGDDGGGGGGGSSSDDGDGDGGGSGDGGGGGSGTSEYPKLIGENGSAKAWELANNSVLLEIHNPDDPDNPREVTFGIGSINSEGTEIVPVGYVRDDSLGQTYAVLRRESDGAIVRRWIAPDSPLALIVPWDDVNSKYTFPVLVIVTIPLDEKRPHPNQLVRRFDGGDDRILSYDADLLQWRHVPDPATFQVLEFYWCDITAADVGFFDRIHIGTPHPPTTVPARDDYPSCRP